MSTNVREAIRKLIIKQYCDRFKIKEEFLSEIFSQPIIS